MNEIHVLTGHLLTTLDKPRCDSGARVTPHEEMRCFFRNSTRGFPPPPLRSHCRSSASAPDVPVLSQHPGGPCGCTPPSWRCIPPPPPELGAHLVPPGVDHIPEPQALGGKAASRPFFTQARPARLRYFCAAAGDAGETVALGSLELGGLSGRRRVLCGGWSPAAPSHLLRPQTGTPPGLPSCGALPEIAAQASSGLKSHPNPSPGL